MSRLASGGSIARVVRRSPGKPPAAGAIVVCDDEKHPPRIDGCAVESQTADAARLWRDERARIVVAGGLVTSMAYWTPSITSKL